MGRDHFRDMRTDVDEHICSDDISCMKHTLAKELKCKFEHGVEKVDTDEAGKVIDMIKDLAAAERYCAQARYYDTVVESMEASDRYMGSMRMGYDPDHDWQMRDDDEWRDMRDKKLDRRRRMRDGIRAEEELDPRYGRSFEDYRRAKKYYTESHDDNMKVKMNELAEQHVTDSIDTLKEIWNSSDPELKQRMKSELAQLVNSMTV